MKKLSNKGFTLIELLATILIIGLVLGLTTYGIISSVKSAKIEGSKLTLAGIKESARTYSNEYTDDTWKASNKSNNIYFCTTIQELINKGLLDKNAKSVEGNSISLNDYIAVVKDKTTKVIKKEFVLTLQAFNEDEEKYEAHQYCTGNIKPEYIKKLPIINKKNTYTDTIIAEFTDAEFKTKDGNVSNIKKRECLYDETTSGNFTSKGTITNKGCKIEGLVQNKNYYVKVCMTSKNDSRACSTPESVKTREVKNPNIGIKTNNSIKILYNDTNIIDENGNHYFKSSISATSNKNVTLYDRDSKTATGGNTTSIEKDKWYKVIGTEVELTYAEEGDFSQIIVTAETRDKSNNSSGEISKTFNRFTTTFSRGIADTINKQTNDIKKTCLANINNGTCKITSPSIEKNNYEVIGWNTDSNAKTSSWDVNTSKNININKTYYPIVRLKQYKVSYKANGGSGTMSDHTVSYGDNITIKANIFTKKGYTFIGWTTKSDGTDDGYNWTNWSGKWEFKNGQYGIANDQLVLYARWRINVVNIKFSTDKGYVKSGAYNWQEKDDIIFKNDSDVFFTIKYGEKIGDNGLPNYNNSNYLYITKVGHSVTPNAEWICSSGDCKGKSPYSQSSTKYKASDFCDASNGDCTVVLKVNWKVNKVFIKFSTNGGSIQSNSTTSSGNAYKWQKNSNNIISRTNANGNTYSDTFFTINYGTSTGTDGLPNYDNSSYLNVSCVNCKDNKNGRGVPNKEWICLEGTCKGTTYNQSSVYNASDFCDASSGDCTVALGVNWEAYKEVNDYRCEKDSNGNSQTDPHYYITSCVGEWCYYTRKNCKSESGSLAWSKVVNCSVETISGCRYDTFKEKEYNSLRCVGGYCCDGAGCTNYSIDRCYLNTNCAVKPTTYTVTFNANGGSGAPSNQVKEHNKNITLSTSKPTRTGYTFVNWNTSSAGNGTSYSAGATYSGNSDITMYAQWRRNRVIINFSVNGGTLISTATYSVDANGIVTQNGSNLHSMYYNDTIMSTGLPNYNNSSYLNIMRNGYEGVSGAEWKCLSGNCTKQTYSQDTNTYKASDFCDASKTDCTITLGVNWTAVKTKTMYINANIGLNCRSGAGTSYSIVTAYACGVPVKVRTQLVNNWWYEVDDECYMSKGGTGDDGNWKEYLVDSRSKLTCPTSSGGSSGGSSDDSSEGRLSNCTCNVNIDCGVAGGNLVKVYCDKSALSGKSTKEGKYMCAWNNKYKPTVTHWCW